MYCKPQANTQKANPRSASIPKRLNGRLLLKRFKFTVTEIEFWAIIRRNTGAQRFLTSPFTIRQHNRAERLQEYFLLAIRKTFGNGSASKHGPVGSRQGRVRWIAASIYEPTQHSLGAAETDQRGGFPGASHGRICMSQRSHKLFINRDMSAKRSIFTV